MSEWPEADFLVSHVLPSESRKADLDLVAGPLLALVKAALDYQDSDHREDSTELNALAQAALALPRLQG